MFHSDVVSLEFSVTLVLEVMGINCFVNPRCFKSTVRKHYVVEHLIQYLRFTVLQMALKFFFDVLKNGLNCVAVRITWKSDCTTFKENTFEIELT